MALTDNLVAWWKMEETSGTRYDSHTNSLDLTDNNTVGYNASGIQGNAADLEKGNSEYLSRSNASLGGLAPADTDFTMAFWAQAESTANGNCPASIWHSGTNNRAWQVQWSTAGSNGLRFRMSSNGSSQTNTGVITFNTATWYFVVCYHDASGNEIGISLDNGSFTTASHSSGAYASDQDFKIGSNNSGVGPFYWDGEIDEFGFWSRVLTGDEITELYNSGSGVTYEDILGGVAPHWHHMQQRKRA